MLCEDDACTAVSNEATSKNSLSSPNQSAGTQCRNDRALPVGPFTFSPHRLLGMLAEHQQNVGRQPSCPRADGSGQLPSTMETSASGFMGVRCSPRNNGCWEAHISTGQEMVYVGMFNSELQAALAHDIIAMKLKGTSAQTNFTLWYYLEEYIAIQQMPMDDLLASLRATQSQPPMKLQGNCLPERQPAKELPPPSMPLLTTTSASATTTIPYPYHMPPLPKASQPTPTLTCPHSSHSDTTLHPTDSPKASLTRIPTPPPQRPPPPHPRPSPPLTLPQPPTPTSPIPKTTKSTPKQPPSTAPKLLSSVLHQSKTPAPTNTPARIGRLLPYTRSGPLKRKPTNPPPRRTVPKTTTITSPTSSMDSNPPADTLLAQLSSNHEAPLPTHPYPPTTHQQPCNPTQSNSTPKVSAIPSPFTLQTPFIPFPPTAIHPPSTSHLPQNAHFPTTGPTSAFPPLPHSPTHSLQLCSEDLRSLNSSDPEFDLDDIISGPTSLRAYNPSVCHPAPTYIPSSETVLNMSSTLAFCEAQEYLPHNLPLNNLSFRSSHNPQLDNLNSPNAHPSPTSLPDPQPTSPTLSGTLSAPTNPSSLQGAPAVPPRLNSLMEIINASQRQLNATSSQLLTHLHVLQSSMGNSLTLPSTNHP